MNDPVNTVTQSFKVIVESLPKPKAAAKKKDKQLELADQISDIMAESTVVSLTPKEKA